MKKGGLVIAFSQACDTVQDPDCEVHFSQAWEIQVFSCETGAVRAEENFGSFHCLRK